MSNPHHRKDATLIETKALPAADGSVSSAAFDLGGVGKQDFVAACDLKVTAPVLTTTELPDADTMIYKVETSADDSTYVTLYGAVITQTGAGGAGAATTNIVVPLRGRIDSTSGNLRRYVRVTATGAGTIGDCSGKELTAELLF
ncbi:hypothetical protein ES703_120841 [subsurface metagenome]